MSVTLPPAGPPTDRILRAILSTVLAMACFSILNAYPYGSGHLLVMPYREVAALEELSPDEHDELWAGVRDAVLAIKGAYSPDGVNIGMNLGHAAGAGIPSHLHVHCLPRWRGDTNFMTSVAETRVLPESLDESWRKLTAAWPNDTPSGVLR